MPVIQPITSASSGSVGTVSSVGLTMPSAFSVANSPITSSGTLAVTALGNATQYIRGDGVLATLPTGSTGGGASVSYYLNGSINQGTIGGVTYYEMNRTPILGAGTDFTRNSNGYIASFLTDANDPALLSIPAGNFNFETYFEASSGGGTPSFYVELYKYDGTTFTLIASNSGSPKVINDGTSIEAYFSALAVPQTTLTLTDRLAIRIYVTTVGRTITLHTENNTLCQVITTFTTGLTALNGLTSQVQFFATGTSGTDFNISSVSSTHTFNIPTASATNRGLLSSTDWLTFSSKQPAITLTTTGNSGASTFNGITGALNIPEYTLIGLGGFANPMTTAGDIIIGRTSGEAERFAGNFTTTRKYFSQIGNGTIVTSSSWEEITPSGIGAVPTSRTLTINGTTLDLTADRSWSVGTVTSVAVSVPTGLSVSGSPITSSGTIAISLTSGYSIPLNASQIEWDIAYTNRITSLTTTGNSGAATLISNTLNIPEYTLAGLGGFANPMTTTGDIIIARSTGEAFRFGGNTSTTRRFFSQIGNGTAVTSSSWYEITSSDVGAVPTTRTLTINGTAFDLSADRSWSVGTVTSVALSVPTGFAVAGSPITTNGTLALSFASGYSLPTTTKQSEWDTAYNRSATALAYNTSTGVITLTKQDTTTLTATITLAPFTTTNLTEGTNLYYTNARARAAISLTTTGSSGSSTYNSTTGVLNVPTYTAAGLGAVPTTRTITINDIVFDLSANREWSVGDYGTW